jgi:hypothetical protein
MRENISCLGPLLRALFHSTSPCYFAPVKTAPFRQTPFFHALGQNNVQIKVQHSPFMKAPVAQLGMNQSPLTIAPIKIPFLFHCALFFCCPVASLSHEGKRLALFSTLYRSP